jgi:hypothetical protein
VTGRPRKPVRVRKARWRGICPRCRTPIVPGQLVASVNRRPWIHASHITDDVRQAARDRDRAEVYDQGEAGPVIAAMLAGLAQARARNPDRR